MGFNGISWDLWELNGIRWEFTILAIQQSYDNFTSEKI